MEKFPLNKPKLLFLKIILLANFFLPKSECTSSFRGVREWQRDTNFGNANNWEGLVDVNCSSNIFSFPEWMDDAVVSWPSNFIGKQIILPVNGHFVFQQGPTTLSDQGACQHGREVKFLRTSEADWFDPQNWRVSNGDSTLGQRAIPQVEKVPCQFDAVKFPLKTTFNLKISRNVTIGKFLMGDEVKTYTDIAIIMSSDLGKRQFQKPAEVDFNLTNFDCKDDDNCLCDNYKPEIKKKICSLAQCEMVNEEECQNPILPHGFCCPICGFHIKIKHSGTLKMETITTKLKSIAPPSLVDSQVEYFVSRYAPKNAHVIIKPPKDGQDSGVNILGQIVAFIKSQPQVTDVTWMGSWNHGAGDVDKWTSQGIGGGTVTFLVFLGVTILIGVMCFIYYRKNGTYPPLTLSTISSLIPSNLSMPTIRMPSMQMPNISLPGRRGNTNAGGRTFGFARFSNERVSTVNIGHQSAADTSTVEREEAVDETIQRIDSASLFKNAKVTQVSPDVGFTNVSYDIVGVDTADNNFEGSGIGMETLGKREQKDESTSGHKKVEAVPAKPLRTLVGLEKAEEPIYNEVFDNLNNDDTSAILIPGLDEE